MMIVYILQGLILAFMKEANNLEDMNQGGLSLSAYDAVGMTSIAAIKIVIVD